MTLTKAMLVLFSVAVGLVALVAEAQEFTGTLKKIRDTGNITLGYRESSVPFSYYDDRQGIIGYTIDLCFKIVDAVKSELKGGANLKVTLAPVTPITRISLLANGAIDLECGSTAINTERQQQVSFTIPHFVTSNRFVFKNAATQKTLRDLKGKTIVSIDGTTNMKQITELNTQRSLGLNIIPAKNADDALMMIDTGQAVAWVTDDTSRYSMIANSRSTGDYVISGEALSVEGIGIMLRKDDPQFKKVVDNAMLKIYQSKEISTIYEKWFLKPIAPKGINLKMPMPAALTNLLRAPLVDVNRLPNQCNEDRCKNCACSECCKP